MGKDALLRRQRSKLVHALSAPICRDTYRDNLRTGKSTFRKEELDKVINDYLGDDDTEAYRKIASSNFDKEICRLIQSKFPDVAIRHILNAIQNAEEEHVKLVTPDTLYAGVFSSTARHSYTFSYSPAHKLYYRPGDRTHETIAEEEPDLADLWDRTEGSRDEMIAELLMGRIHDQTVSFWNYNQLLDNLLIPCLKELLKRGMAGASYRVFSPQHTGETIEEVLDRVKPTSSADTERWKSAAQLPHVMSPMGKMGGNAAWNQIGSKKDWRQAMALKGIPSGEKTGTWGESFETGSEQLLRTRINTMAKEIAENLAVHITKNPPEFIRLKTEIEQTIINWFGSDLKKAYLKTLSPHLAFEIYGAITNISPKIELNVVSQIMKRLAYYGKIHLYELNPDETYRMSQEDKENQHAFVFDSNHKLYYVGGEETHVDAIVKNPELESLFSDDETFEDREFVMSKGLLLGRIYKDTISIWNSNPLLNKLLVPCLQALLDKKLIAYGYHVFTPHHDAETVEKILSKKVKTTAPANASWKAAAQLPHLISPMNKVGGDAAWHQLGKGKDWRQAMTARGLTPGSGTGIWGESFKEWLQKNK